MKKEEFLKSNYYKLLLPIVGIALVIGIWQSGYEFGKWLFKILN